MWANYLKGLKTKFKVLVSFVKKHPFKSIFYAMLTGLSFTILLVLLTYLGAFGKLPSKISYYN